MEEKQLRKVLRTAQSLAKRTKPLQREVEASVDAQRTDALLCNWSCHKEFFTPSPSLQATCSKTQDTQEEDVAKDTLRLLPHQKDGVRWLLAMHARQRSALVADEMGLGKTVQVLAFFSALASRGCLGTFLIVAPLNTLANWEKEAQTWLPWMHLTRFQGNAATREKLRARLRKRHRQAFERAGQIQSLWVDGDVSLETRVMRVAALVGGVVLTSYEMLMADKGALSRLLAWDVMVVDEAQRLKRMDCKLLQELHKAHNGAMKVILSGTPVQNNAKELWTLLEFVAPDYFEAANTNGSNNVVSVHEVVDAWVRRRKQRDTQKEASVSKLNDARKQGPTKRARTTNDGDEAAVLDDEPQDFTSTRTHDADDTSGSIMREIVAALHVALQPFMLRRTKVSAGLPLPPKVQLILPTPLTSLQQHVYRLVQEKDAFLNNRTMHLRRCCLYPGPLVEQIAARQGVAHDSHTNPGDDAKPNKKGKTSTGTSSTQREAPITIEAIHRVVSEAEDPYTVLSSKLHVLAQMLPRLHASGHRVLLFSQFTTVLDVVEDFLCSQLPSLTYARLDGVTKSDERGALLAQFQATPPPKEGEPMRLGSLDGTDLHQGGMPRYAGGNVENGLLEDNAVFETPPAKAKAWSKEPVQGTKSFYVRHRGVVGARVPLGDCTNVAVNAAGKGHHVKLHDIPCAKQQRSPSSATAAPAVEKTFLFLISTRAGGAGLNLTGADTVILFDGDFNPHNDRQAIDRCHRIGQRRPVVVYRLVCPGTVEAHQLTIAVQKLSLEAAVLKTSSASTSSVAPSGGRHCSQEVEYEGDDLDKVFVVCGEQDSNDQPCVSLQPFSAVKDRLSESSFSTGGGDTTGGVWSPMSPQQLSLVLDRPWLLQATGQTT